jgi:16S rRNA (cytosine1402-N4)-methyltransferase
MKTHITVFEKEAVEALAIKASSIIVDATLGSSGHAIKIVNKLGKNGIFIGIDADSTAIDFGKKNLTSKAKLYFVHDNFQNISSIIKQIHSTKVDGILADLGWRMDQFSGSGKGFSFLVDEPLIMTFGDPSTYVCTARDIVNEWSENDIFNVLKGYGEERFAKRITHAIVHARVKKPIETTFDLVRIISDAVPKLYQKGRIHPATRSFQGLRIAVNDELSVLETFIKASIDHLQSHGRLVIITFHSIEDRIVKYLFQNYARDHVGYVLTKKPIIPSSDEVTHNPRSRSAKMRIFEKI